MNRFTVLILSIFVLLASACTKSGSPKEKPEIVYNGLSQNTIINGNLKDTVIINLRYTIAADKLGSGNDVAKVILKDSREENTSTPIPFPDIPVDNIDDKNNVSGTITLILPAALYLVLRPDHPDGDTLYYEIYVEDKDEVRSNTVTTDTLYIVP